MKLTMKRTLALVMALMLALPTFVLADDAAVELEANGQATINGLALEEDPVLDGDMALTLDGLSLDLDGLQTPTEGQGQPGQPSEGGEVSVEGGEVEQPGASEDGAPEETPVELEDGARAMDESIPEAQPLMPPDYAVDVALEGENVTDPAMMANDGESQWQELVNAFNNNSEFTLNKSYTASESDERLISASAFTLNLNNYTIDRKRSEAKNEGNVIYTSENLTINGPGKITGGKTVSQKGGNYGGGGIAVSGNKTLTLNEGVEITGNHAYSDGSWGCGGGVYLGESGSSVNKNKLKMNNTSAIKSNTAHVFGGGVFLAEYAELEMKDDASISGNEAAEGGGGRRRVCWRYLYHDRRHNQR